MNRYQSRGGKADVRNQTWNRAAWQRTRKAVLARDLYTCRDCGSKATSVHHLQPVAQLVAEGRNPCDPDECVALCAACHGRQHGGARKEVKPVTRVNRFLTTPAAQEAGYNKAGGRLVLVAGPPGAGKTTYVKEHKEPHDLVWDYDAVLASVSGGAWNFEINRLMMAMRAAYIKAAETYPHTCWLIASAPTRAEQDEISSNVVLLAVDAETCIARTAKREDGVKWTAIIRRWWEKYTP
ncbi:MAG: hypothetical protein DDT34_02351 [Firmicutes bacterium]|nr:hypothetical protein [Bacillota bacterium]